MEENHPEIVTICQSGRDHYGALEPWEGAKPAGAETPSDPEAEHIAGEAAEPANDDKSAETQCARMGGVAREQRKQKAMRGRIGKHETVSRIAVLAYEFQERCEVRRKEHQGPALHFFGRFR